MNELVTLALQAADAAAGIIREAYDRPERTRRFKGAVDLVTATDQAAEVAIRRALAPTGIPILGEEDGLDREPDDLLWVVDPLDGTTNFAHRVPHFAVSIGLWSTQAHARGERAALLGVIAQPVSGEVFWADEVGAWLNDTPLSALTPPPLNEALVATGFPYDRREVDNDNTDLWRVFMKRAQGVRRMGAAALDMAFVAAGRLDGFWEPRLKPWDLAAGIAIAERVGCRVTRYNGAAWSFDAPDVLVAAPPLWGTMRDVIHESTS